MQHNRILDEANLSTSQHTMLEEPVENAMTMSTRLEQAPIFTQGSIGSGAQALNKKLRELFGDYQVILTNTGAETVETAVKHAIFPSGEINTLVGCGGLAASLRRNAPSLA